MNNRMLLIGGAVVVIVLGGLAFFYSAKNKAVAPTTNQTQTETQPSEAPTTSASETPSRGKETQVTLTANGFSPKNITIAKGAKVVWTNKSGAAATVNSSPHPAHTDYPPLNLNSFADGDTLELTFNDAGTYRYHNHFNAVQGGSVTVK